jgi:hypothetical protein
VRRGVVVTEVVGLRRAGAAAAGVVRMQGRGRRVLGPA